MDKKIAGLLGAVAALGAVNAAQAAPSPSPAPSDVLRANSFADLLEPIPNAAKLLQAITTAIGRASWSYRRDIGTTTTTIITTTIITITAITAIDEAARDGRMRKQDPPGPVLASGARARS
jgi:hypothetical protein